MEEVTLFRIEEQFLKFLYDTKGVTYSKNKVLASVNITPELLLEKKYNLEYCDITTHSEGVTHLESIFKSKSNFYIYDPNPLNPSFHHSIIPLFHL